MFLIGAKVNWTSSSNSSTTRKTGVVEAIIAPGKLPKPAQRKEADAYGNARDHTSYLVRVPGKTAQAKGKLYWPRTSLLQPAEAGFNTRKLRPSGRVVAELAAAVTITLNTKCPSKWALVDMETGEIWGHDGVDFRRISGKDAAEVATVAAKSSRKKRDSP